MAKLFTFSDTVNVVKGQIMANYPKWGHLYKIEFDITVRANLPAKWHNVFHFTANYNNENYGDRVPAFLLNREKLFYIASSVNGLTNHYFTSAFELGTKYHIAIHQFEDHDEKVIFRIEIDNQIIHEDENKQAWDFTNVKLYVSDPWHEPFDSSYGTLENLRISQSGVYHYY